MIKAAANLFLPHTPTGCPGGAATAATLHPLNHTSSSSEISLIPGKVYSDGPQKGRAPPEWPRARPGEGGGLLSAQSGGFCKHVNLVSESAPNPEGKAGFLLCAVDTDERFPSEAQAHLDRLFHLGWEKPPKPQIPQGEFANIISLQVQQGGAPDRGSCFQHTSLKQFVPLFCLFHLKRLYLSPRAHPQPPNCQETQMGQSAASDVSGNALTGAHTRSSVHCVTQLRCWSTHDARVLTSRAQRDKHTRGP